MMKLETYIMFAGNCREAMNFYKDCLGGELNFMTFGESNMPSEPAQKDQIMHSTLKTDGFILMASDGAKASGGSNVHLSLDFTDVPQMDNIFGKLSQGGNVTMPLQDTFWNARFGMLTDKYGTNWMLNCNKEQPK